MKSALAVRAIPLLVSALLAGCATPRLEKIEAGREIAIVSANRSTENFLIDISNKVIGKDAGTGALGGMAAGAPIGLGCGGFAVLCVPITALIGAGIGALGGVAVGVVESLPAETSQQLRSRLDAYRAGNDPRQQVVQAIADKAKGQWTLAAPGSPTTLLVKLEEVAVHSLREDRVALVVRAAVTVRRASATTTSDGDTKTFDYEGPASDVRLWIEDRNNFVAGSFNHAYGHIARSVFADLAR
jgi:hypothetical protein